MAAAETYRQVLELAGDPPLPVACEAHLGLARIFYEWNDLAAAQQHVQQGAYLARQIANTDRFVACDLFMARLKLAQGDEAGAAALVAAAEQAVQRHSYVQRTPDVAAVRVLILLAQGNPAAALPVADTFGPPSSQARVRLALGDAPAALAMLEPLRQGAETRQWQDERLKALLLEAVALQAGDAGGEALQLLQVALATAEPGGFIRSFVDEGPAMAQLLAAAATQRISARLYGQAAGGICGRGAEGIGRTTAARCSGSTAAGRAAQSPRS